MRTRVTLQLLDEADRFSLRYTCDDCVHFKPSSQLAAGISPRSPTCAHNWPRGERRRTLSVGEEIEFCKEFESC